jgi:outer membrane protein assembly factor BamE (lipoprotein component of BamABCDE complex)
MHFILLCFCLIACTPNVDVRGFNPEHSDFKSIKLHEDTTNTVQEKLGSPGATGTFPDQSGKTIWYYVYKKTSTTSFYRPETLEQKVVIIIFDKAGKVESIQEKNGEDPIEPNPNQTESAGYESTLMRDIFGGFGKYSSQKPKQ